ncbi:AmmeMemoRadiSam system protein B [candidate division KSB1 bacterium]|nr:AmmeMemoRadiSam system protein B [candidate division KSB1 bacterium]
MSNLKPKKRVPAWAGQFYPLHPQRLSASIESYLGNAQPFENTGDIVGLIAPHAGYEYSGRVAAAGYRQIQGLDVSTVVVLAPSHVEIFPGVSIYNGEAYLTPLGSVAVDQEIARAITERSSSIYVSESGHRTNSDRAEHSLEVQLPFLQSVLKPGFKIVPMVIHDFDAHICENVGHAIVRSLPEKALIVASSDLYHGYSYDECIETDERTLAAIEKADPVSFIDGIHAGLFQACGAGPIAVLMEASRQLSADRVTIAARTNSADVTGIRSGWKVGYASVLFSRQSRD